MMKVQRQIEDESRRGEIVMHGQLGRSESREFSFYQFPKLHTHIRKEILSGLRKPQKTIDPKFFYDDHGSQLYEKITRTFDYYVTRTENEILRRNTAEIAAVVGSEAVIIEPGAGNCKKIELLLEALRPCLYAPIDISTATLEDACVRLSGRYDWLSCFGIAADFEQFELVADLLPHKRRVVFFPGSTIGNFEPAAALIFLKYIRSLVKREGGLLIGVDNIKDAAILERAYHDRDGVTALFNKNVLSHINRIAAADFDLAKFEHRACWNAVQSRIEMHLVSMAAQQVTVAGEAVNFTVGETIHTESAYKYTRASFAAFAAQAGFRCTAAWHDQNDYFTLYYFECDPYSS